MAGFAVVSTSCSIFAVADTVTSAEDVFFWQAANEISIKKQMTGKKILLIKSFPNVWTYLQVMNNSSSQRNGEYGNGLAKTPS